jgi:hypothetical protein
LFWFFSSRLNALDDPLLQLACGEPPVEDGWSVQQVASNVQSGVEVTRNKLSMLDVPQDASESKLWLTNNRDVL